MYALHTHVRREKVLSISYKQRAVVGYIVRIHHVGNKSVGIGQVSRTHTCTTTRVSSPRRTVLVDYIAASEERKRGSAVTVFAATTTSNDEDNLTKATTRMMRTERDRKRGGHTGRS